MTLSKRLETIIDLVPKSKTACDIGCDHAYVAIELVLREKVSKVYAMDINEGPLAIADKNVKTSGLNRRIKLLLSDGLNKLEEACETIIIAGMGGALIEKILRDDVAKVLKAKSLVLSPQSEEGKVRSLLYELGFFIEEEKVVEDLDKIYFVIKAVKGSRDYGYDYRYSESLIKAGDPSYLDFVLKKIAKLSGLLSRVPETRQKELRKEIAEMEEIADEIKRNR